MQSCILFPNIIPSFREGSSGTEGVRHGQRGGCDGRSGGQTWCRVRDGGIETAAPKDGWLQMCPLGTNTGQDPGLWGKQEVVFKMEVA